MFDVTLVKASSVAWRTGLDRKWCGSLSAGGGRHSGLAELGIITRWQAFISIYLSSLEIEPVGSETTRSLVGGWWLVVGGGWWRWWQREA